MSLASMALGLVIVPVPGNAVGSFPGDIVLLLYLLEVPVLCDVMAGYVSQSIYGQVSAMREAVMSLGYNLPFLAAVIAMAQKAGSFRLGDLQACSLWSWSPVWPQSPFCWRCPPVSRATRSRSPMPNRRSSLARTSNTTVPRSRFSNCRTRSKSCCCSMCSLCCSCRVWVIRWRTQCSTSRSALA